MSLGVLARATKAVTAHVKELKGKSNNKVENGRLKNDNSPSTDSACIILDSTTNTTYVRGKVLGKVRIFFLVSFIAHYFVSSYYF